MADHSHLVALTKQNNLTVAQFNDLAAVPPEAEWFANLDSAQTRRAYKNDIGEFMRFTGIERPEQFRDIARAILGNTYELSLVICSDTLAQRMNQQYRNKSYTPNVLSFSLMTDTGEIFLNLRASEREAKKYNLTLTNRVAYLFIHACVHLAGHDHGREMDKLEKRFLKRFGYTHPVDDTA